MKPFTKDLKEIVIEPVLDYLSMSSESAINIMLGTPAQETKMGRNLKQLNGGPALSIYQIEPNTYNDIYRYLERHPDLKKLVDQLRFPGLSWYYNLAGNLYYATAIARIKYWMVPKPLPLPDDIEGLAAYWKKYYNTSQGAGTQEEFIESYKKYVL